MTADDLSTPLGQTPAPRKRRRLPVSGSQVTAVALGLFLLAFLGFALFNEDPLGGEPTAHVSLRPAATSDNPAARAAPDAGKPGSGKASAEPAAADGQRTITIIDGSSGTRQQVVLPNGPKDSKNLKDGKTGTEHGVMPGIESRLLEPSRYGMIPVAADGLKPFTAYAEATDAERAKAAAMPTVAVVIRGLGVDTARADDAIKRLPPEVTLAFTPYGPATADLVGRARARHHEAILQVPMEPTDYPDNDPGPQTLLTSLGADQNLDRLHWALSRFQGYVALASFMGARFVASDAMQPIIQDAARRGLGYLDDGSSPRSVAGSLAAAQSMPFSRADLTIDALPTPDAIDKSLASLENLAKTHGNAVGIASALPVSIERIAAWSRGLQGRGIMLVPLTTAMLKSKSS